MARPNTAVLKRVQVLEAPAEADLRPVMQVPAPCASFEEFERVAIPQQAALMKWCAEDRRE